MVFDIIGDIVILKPPLKYSPEEYVKKILEKHKFVRVILLQQTDVQPPYRVPEYKILWGENRTETIHKEFGLKFKVDVVRTYYSPRLSSERYRIAKMVRDGEKVLVMFAGVNPYAIYIAKFAKPKIVYSIELNPFAVKYALENTKINKVQDKIVTILGDVRKVSPLILLFNNGDGYIHSDENYIIDVLSSRIQLNLSVIEFSKDYRIQELYDKMPANKKYIVTNNLGFLKNPYKYDGFIRMNENEFYVYDFIENSIKEYELFGEKFDRIVMPLPKEADTFLDVAIPLIKEGGIIHLYQFMFEEEIPKKANEILDKYSSLLDFEYEILNVRKVGDIAPRQYRVCIDFKVTKKYH